MLQMHRLDRGDQRDMRADLGNQRRDFPRMVHPHFEHAIICIQRHPRQRQRHTEMIVVGRHRGMGAALMRQNQPQGLFGAGLADRTADRNNLTPNLRALCHAQPFQSLQGPQALCPPRPHLPHRQRHRRQNHGRRVRRAKRQTDHGLAGCAYRSIRRGQARNHDRP